MIKALVYADKTMFDAHQKRWGRFNDFPPGWHRITQKQFAQSHFFTYDADAIEFRQMHPKDGRTVVQAKLYFFFDGRGYGIVNDYYKGKIEYYAFGCPGHEWGGKFTEEEKQQSAHLGRCMTAYKCKLCGHFQIVDSSD